MHPAHQFARLGQKQLAIQEGIQLLQENRAELQRTISQANMWGGVAVMANVALVPLNCIVNAFQLGKANSLYQTLVRQLYSKSAASGTRVDGQAKEVLKLLKAAVVEELKRRALTQYVPGVNVLVGLSEDALAAYQKMQMVTTGQAEMRQLLVQIDQKIAAATRELTQIGIRRAELLDRMGSLSRTV